MSKQKEKKEIEIIATQNIPAFIGLDMKENKPFIENEIRKVNKKTAEILCSLGLSVKRKLVLEEK